jgi:PRTRC genetic system protein E
MFKTFHDMLKSDERIQFTVTRKGDQLAVLVQPVLQGASDDKASDTILSLRGALSMPLYVITHPENLDRDFPQSLADFAGIREQGHSDLNEVMSRIKEAGKQAKAAADADKTETGNSKAKTEPLANSSNNVPATNGKTDTPAPATVSLSEKSLF